VREELRQAVSVSGPRTLKNKHRATMTKRTEITIETRRITVIRKTTAVVGWCAECDQEVDWVTVDQAVRMTGSSWREVFRTIESGEIHANETGELVHMRVCNQE